MWFVLGLIVGLIVGKIGPIVILQKIEEMCKENLPKIKEKYFTKTTDVDDNVKNSD